LAGFIGAQLTLWSLTPYRPRLAFDKDQARILLSLGWPLLISSFFRYITWKGDDLLVRYFWGDEQLAYYVLAFSLPYYLKELADMISTVLLPAFTEVQDLRERLTETFSASNRYLAMLFMPIGIAIFIFAPQIVHYVYTDKWAPSIPLLQLCAISFILDISLGFTTGLLAIAIGKVKYILYAYLVAMMFIVTGGVFLIRQYGPLGGAYYTILQPLITVLFVQIPFVFKEIGTLKYLWEIWRPLVAGVGAGLLTHFLIIPWVKSFTSLSV